MKKPRVLDGLTHHGRLTRRLEEIEARADARELPRSDAGDRIREEVVDAIGVASSPAERELLVRAHLAQARLFHASDGATPLEAAEALFLAAAHDAYLGPCIERAAAFALLARSMLDKLRELNSRRTSFRVFKVLCDAVAVAPDAGVKTAELFDLAPSIWHGAIEASLEPQLPEVADRLSAVLDRDAGVEDAEREHRRAVLFRLNLSAKDGVRALSTYPGPTVATAREIRDLAILVTDGAPLSEEALRVVDDAMSVGAKARAILETRLKKWGHVDENTPAHDLPLLESANRKFARYCRDAGWPLRNLVHIYAQREDDRKAVAAFALMHDRSVDRGDAAEVVAPILLCAGFRRAAAESGDAVARLLVRAEEALDARAERGTNDDGISVALERVVAEARVPRRLRARVHQVRARLLLVSGQIEPSLGLLETALSLEPGSTEVAADLAEALVVSGQHSRAHAFVDLASSGGDCARTCALQAALLERGGRLDDAARLLERALKLHVTESKTDDGGRAIITAWERARLEIAEKDDGPSAFLTLLRDEAAQRSSFVRGSFHPETLRRRAAHLAERAGNFALVRTLLEPVRGTGRLDEPVAILLGRADLHGGDAAAAVALLEGHASSQSGELQALLGIAYQGLGRKEQAVEHLRRAATAGSAAAAVALCGMLSEAGHEDEALAVLDAFAPPDGSNDEMIFQVESLRASLLERAGNGLGAIAALVKALCVREDESLRIRYGLLSVTLALREHDDAHARQHLLGNAINALGLDVENEGEILGAVAEHMLDKPARLSCEVVEGSLLEAARREGPASRSAEILVNWMRFRWMRGECSIVAAVARAAADVVGETLARELAAHASVVDRAGRAHASIEEAERLRASGSDPNEIVEALLAARRHAIRHPDLHGPLTAALAAVEGLLASVAPAAPDTQSEGCRAPASRGVEHPTMVESGGNGMIIISADEAEVLLAAPEPAPLAGPADVLEAASSKEITEVVTPAPADPEPDPQQVERRLAIARERAEEGRVRTAREVLQQVYRDAQASGAADCARKAIELLYDVNRRAEAELVKKTIAAIREHLGRREFRAAIQLLGGDHDSAIDFVPELLELRFRAHIGLERADDARRDLDLLKPAMARGEITVSDAEFMLQRIPVLRMLSRVGSFAREAWIALEDGRAEEALRCLSEHRSKEGRHPVALLLRARALHALGIADEARIALDEGHQFIDRMDDDDMKRFVLRETSGIREGIRP